MNTETHKNEQRAGDELQSFPFLKRSAVFVATSNNPQVGFTSRGSKARCGASVGWLAGTTGI